MATMMMVTMKPRGPPRIACPRRQSAPRINSAATRPLNPGLRPSASSVTASSGQMQTVKLGSSDLLVSEVCMGTMTFGQQNSEAESHRLMSACRDAGVNFYDTAEMYPVAPSRETQGRSSEIIGSWLAKQDRSSAIIASKVVGRSDRQTWIPAGRTLPKGEDSVPRLDRASIKAACEAELRRLRSDYIDLFYLHWPDRYVPAFGAHRYRLDQEREAVPFEEQVGAVGELLAEGKIRHWALSNETTDGVVKMCQAADELGVPRPVVLQQSYSLIHREAEGSLAELCSPTTLGLGVLPWSAMAGGVLSGKYFNGQMPSNARMTQFPGRYSRFMTPHVLNAAKRYSEVAAAEGLTPAQLAYAFCRSQWFIPSTIIGATTEGQLQENLRAFTHAPLLSEDTLAAIDAIYLDHRDPSLED